MAVTADQERVKTLLTETIILLCKNGLHFKNEFTVEGLIGITVDKNDVFLINIKETIRLGNHQPSCFPVNEVSYHNQRQHKRKRRRNSRSSCSILNNLESEVSDRETPKPNASSDDLASKCFSNCSDSPLRTSTHQASVGGDPSDHRTRKGHEDSRRDFVGMGVCNSRVLNGSCSFKKHCRYDDHDGISGTSGKINTSPDATHFDDHVAMHVNRSARAEKNFSNSAEECDSISVPVKVKEELEEVEQLGQIERFSSCPKLFPVQEERHSLYSGTNYSSLVDGSYASNIDHQTFQLFHGAEQNSADQQVELLPGSGVYVSMRAYVHLNEETWVRGSKLVRRVVREVFPDEHILAQSSCLGRRLGGCHVGLDHHKVDTIKAFVQQRMPHVSHTEIVAAINECCRDIRAKLRKSYFRSANNSNLIKPV